MFSRIRSGPFVPVARAQASFTGVALATAVNEVAGIMEPSHKSPVLSSCRKAAAGTGDASRASTRQAKAMDARDRHWVGELVGRNESRVGVGPHRRAARRPGPRHGNGHVSGKVRLVRG